MNLYIYIRSLWDELISLSFLYHLEIVSSMAQSTVFPPSLSPFLNLLPLFTSFLSPFSLAPYLPFFFPSPISCLECTQSEEALATHSSTLAWKIPWMEEPGRLQSMGSLRVGHNWATSLSLFTFTHWRRKWQPTPVFLPGESQGRGSLVGCHLVGCYGVEQSRTRLKRLSSSSSSPIQEGSTFMT